MTPPEDTRERLDGTVAAVIGERPWNSRTPMERTSVGGRQAATIGLQSSGILIQPWRMAYTTAWVRSLTESLRRMLLMWFLTVCSLMDSA